MFTAKKNPEFLFPDELDSYLEKGWFRSAQSIFTTHFYLFHHSFYSTIWIRLPLKDFAFSKSNRKLIRKNLGRFHYEFLPARCGFKEEALFRLYRDHFPFPLNETLREYLGHDQPNQIFNTMELAVYDGERLVAASFFDLGSKSIASITGIYHPDYSSYSLGFFTMLMEVQYGMDNGYHFFYPGYVVPGYPRFDYKLRIGPQQYLDLSKQDWLPYEQLSAKNIPINRMRERLYALAKFLRESQIEHKVLKNNFYSYRLAYDGDETYFDYPLFIFLDRAPEEPGIHSIIFNPGKNYYELLLCRLSRAEYGDIVDTFWPEFPYPYSSFAMQVTEVLAIEEKPRDMVQRLKKDGF